DIVEINPEVWAEEGKYGYLDIPPIKITMQKETPPIRVRQYPISPEGRKGLALVIEHWLVEGILEPCMSPRNTLILALKKAEGKYRLVQDLREAQIHLALLQNLNHRRVFKKITKFTVNQMSPFKDLVPVESIADNEHIRPLCLLTKKRKSKRIFHPAPYYKRTGFTLDDVLLPGKDGQPIESIYQDSSQFTLTKTSTDQVDGDLSISVDPAIVRMQGADFFYKGFSIKPQKKSISLQLLEELRRERKINMDHSFILQLQRTDIELYLVTEILEASEKAVYKESTKANGGFKAKFYATFSAQGTRENSQSIVIPKGCTLAFRIIPIHIRNGEWGKQFPEITNSHILEKVQKDLGYFPIGDMVKPIQQGSWRKLRVEVTEVKYSCRIFSKLSSDLLLILLNTIKAVMRDNNLLQELSQKVSEAFLTATF
ncbi:hypothetical protein HGM15179_013989, partial [Zosterops borbonicus]